MKKQTVTIVLFFFMALSFHLNAQNTFDWTGTIVSGNGYGSSVVGNLIDGSETIGWGSPNHLPPHTIDFELPTNTTFNGFGFFKSTNQTAGGWGHPIYTPTGVALYGSVDNVNFDNLLMVNENTLTNEWNDYTFTNTTAYKYYRLVLTSTRSGWIAITEIRAFYEIGPCINDGGDADGDGFCANEDCDDNDPNFPKDPGTTCDDGDPNTTNDQYVGCDCIGTLIQCEEIFSHPPYEPSICQGDSLQLDNFSVGTTFSWQPTSGLDDPTKQFPIAAPTVSTTYTVTGYADTTCTTYTFTLTVNADNDNDGICGDEDCDDNNPLLPKPPGTPCDDKDPNTVNDQYVGCDCIGISCAVVNTTTPYEPSICRGDSVQLANYTSGVTFSWSPATGLDDPTKENPMASPTENTTYTVTGIAADSTCTTYTFTLYIHELPVVQLGKNKTICPGDPVQLSASASSGGNVPKADSSFMYTWSPVVSLNDPSIPNPIATPVEQTTYTVTVTDDVGCQASASITINMDSTMLLWYIDADGDGFGHSSDSILACSQPAGYVDNAIDCDDLDSLVVNFRWCKDADQDGYGSSTDSIYVGCTPAPDYVLCSTLTEERGDCNDTIWDIKDQITWYFDGDNDGFGNPDSTLQDCIQPTGYVLDNTDCDDRNMDIPAMPGTACDDLDSLTINDVILEDGCTCEGRTPREGGFFIPDDHDGDVDIRYSGGKVVIGNDSIQKPGTFRLLVEAGILTEEVVIAIANSGQWADDVFEKDYPLRSVEAVEQFIQENQHLPGVPSVAEVIQQGIKVGEMQAILLRQIEELWLHVIEQEKRMKVLEGENEKLRTKNR